MKILKYKGKDLLTLSPDSKKLRAFHQSNPRKLKAWLAKNFKGVGVADFLNLPHHNNHRTALTQLGINK